MFKLIKHLWLPVSLILAASSILLISDWNRRTSNQSPQSQTTPRPQLNQKTTEPKTPDAAKITLAYFGQMEVFEQAIEGFRAGLEHHGYHEGDNLELILGHANADMSLIPQVTLNLAQKNPDIFAVFSTPNLCNAIAQVKEAPIVFGIVSAPLEAKAGTAWDDHLPNVTGTVFMNPTEDTIRWSREFFPEAKRFGTLYNPSEANSVKEIEDLKRYFQDYGFELISAPINNSNEIPQSLQSLFLQDLDLFFLMADNTLGNAIPSVVRKCMEHHIPVIADDKGMMGSGAVLTAGPSPYIEGFHTAEIAVRVLQGEDPAHMPFETSIDHPLAVDFKALKHFNIPFPKSAQEACRFAFNFSEYRDRPAQIAMVNLIDAPTLDLGLKSIEEGLQEYGLVMDKDYQIKHYNAQGDLSLLPQIFDTAAQSNPDMIISVSSPALMAGAHKVKDVPYLYCIASNPDILGLFKNGKPSNISGVYADSNMPQLIDMAQEYVPDLKHIGVIFDPSQSQSVIEVEILRKEGKLRGIDILEATANQISEIPTGTQSLIQKGAQTLILSADNLVSAAFPAIHHICQKEGIPIFVSDLALIDEGATGGVGPDYVTWGKQTAHQAIKLLNGVPIESIPMEIVSLSTSSVPEKMAVSPISSNKIRELRLAMYNETQFAEDCAAGLIEGLTREGFIEGQDYHLRTLNAQGDMSTLSSIMTSIKSERVDLLMVISTPCLQAALRQVGPDTNIVFTGVGDGVKAGAGKSETDHLPNITGITTRSPFKGMARVIKESMPHVTRVGTLFTPAEINSELYRGWFEDALDLYGIELVAVPVTASSETSQATDALCQKDIQAIAQIVDNTTRPGFAQIARKAADNNLPVFVFDSSQMKEGASICVARDYFDAGVEGGEKAARVLRGENPAEIPFNNTRSEKMLVNRKEAKKYGLIIPEKALDYEMPPKSH